jgi:CBS domain-containing protein
MATLCPSCGAKNIEGVDECENCHADLRTVDLPKPSSQFESTVMHQPLTALELMNVHAVSPDTPLDVAVQTLVRQKVSLLEVVEGGRLVGVLSIRDVLDRVGADYAAKLTAPVKEFMTPGPETLPPDAPVTFAINRMDVGGYRHVPIVQDERMVGVVSALDVVRFVVRHAKEAIATTGVTTSHGVDQDRSAAAAVARG